VGIYQCSGNLAVVHHPQSPPPDGTVGGNSQPVRPTAIYFHDGQEPLVEVRKTVLIGSVNKPQLF
jgi:hypothetical protein